ncbi:hypothetical protein GGE09_002917 [Roseobacter sp. N2S]|nr:hypothetical protein [Roseobacter sp. N2S]
MYGTLLPFAAAQNSIRFSIQLDTRAETGPSLRFAPMSAMQDKGCIRRTPTDGGYL